MFRLYIPRLLIVLVSPQVEEVECFPCLSGLVRGLMLCLAYYLGSITCEIIHRAAGCCPYSVGVVVVFTHKIRFGIVAWMTPRL